MQDKKHTKPEVSFLKKVFFKKEKLVRLKLSYGVNILLDQKFFVAKQSVSQILIRTQDEENKILNENKINLKKKKKKLNFLYLAINLIVVAIVLWVQLSKEGDPKDSLATIFNVNWWFILVAFGTFLLGMFVDQVRYSFLIHKATGVFRFRLAYKVAAVGKYYDTITPLSTGGQPFQVVYMNKYGISAGKGLSVSMGRYIFHQIVYFLFVSFFLFRNLIINSGATGAGSSTSAVTNGVATTFSWIGYVICAVVLTTTILVALNRRIGGGLVVGVLKLLSKIRFGKFRLIKDYKKSFKSVMGTVNVWQKTTKEYGKSTVVIFMNVLSTLIYLLCSYSMPFFIYCAFEGWDPTVWAQIVTMAIMVDLASAFNPIPMGTGTADISFTAFFASFFAGGAQFWALIIWRILFYYIYIIQGLGIVVYDYAVGNKRLEKHKEYWMLPLKERAIYRKEHSAKKY